MHFAVYGCWALASEGKFARIVASSGDKSWIDLNKDRSYSEADAKQSFGIIALGEVGKGNFVIFGDDAIFQNRFLTGHKSPTRSKSCPAPQTLTFIPPPTTNKRSKPPGLLRSRLLTKSLPFGGDFVYLIG